MSQLKAQLRRDGFTFKQFFVAHDRCAMKVGTDGILLGAWAPVAGVKRILDIGTGSGLQALMLAQRTEEHVTIDAVELDPQAAQQASENAADSPWAERIRVDCADVLTSGTGADCALRFDRQQSAVFHAGVECGTPEREQARYTGSLDHKALLTSAAELISEEGFFCVVLPESTGNTFIEIARDIGWSLRLRTDISDTEGRLPHRVLLALSPKEGSALPTGWLFAGQTSVIPKITLP